MSQSVSVRGTVSALGPSRIKRGNRTKRRQNITGILFVAPFFVFFLLMLVVPLFYSGYLSLFKTQIVGGAVFAGLGNYIQALGDSQFLQSVARMALFLVILVPIMLGLALFIALALDSGRVRGSKFVRLAIFVPYAVPGVVAALMWGYLYGRDFGPISQLITAIGLPTPDLLSANAILGSMINIVVWEFVGYNMIIMYAALRSIPTELYDAAEVDGAGQIRIAWSIKIPALRPAILLTVIFTIIGCFQLFSEPNLLYHLAPSAVGVAFSPNLYAYNLAFVNQNINYAAAISFLLGIVIMIVSYVVQLSAAKRERKSDVQ
jgi:multiple sugar transport system permease protein